MIVFGKSSVYCGIMEEKEKKGPVILKKSGKNTVSP
jgi:hypothetical protein